MSSSELQSKPHREIRRVALAEVHNERRSAANIWRHEELAEHRGMKGQLLNALQSAVADLKRQDKQTFNAFKQHVRDAVVLDSI